MPTRGNDDVERRLRSLEDVEDDSVRMVVAGAFERGATHGARRRVRVGFAAAACVVVACAVVVYRYRVARSTLDYFPVTPVDSLVLIEPSEGPCWILGPAADTAETAPGGGYVLIEGEDR